MELREILSRCDHTLLRVDATAAEIRALCDQGMRYGCASVCIPPCHVAGAKKYVGDRLRICTVIGFPNGYHTPAVKAFEAAEAIRNGADEVDMVVNLAMVKDGCWDDVAADIRAVREASRGCILKVIIECCLLTEEEKRMLCRIVSDSGADYQDLHRIFHRRRHGGRCTSAARLLPAAREGQGCRRHREPCRRGGVHSPRRRPSRHEPRREDRHGAGAGCTERCRSGRSGRAGHDLLSRAQAGERHTGVPLPAALSAFLRFDTENT